MGKKNKRPVYLNLLKIRLPVTGVVSIVHRATGVLLVLLLPGALYLLQRSLQDPDAFAKIASTATTLPGRLVWLLIVWVFAQHFFSGVRHLLLDVDIGIERTQARCGAWLAFIAATVVVVLAGVCL